jgi:phage terminase small subunit
MNLTPKQEQFAQLVASGKSQTDAYRGAYNVSDKTKPESIMQEASKLMTNPKVATRVKELKGELANKALWTREDSVKALKRLIETESGGVVVSALKELNLMHGFNAPIKQEITGSMNNTVEIVLIDP